MPPKNIVVIGASSVFGRIDPKGGGFVGRLKTWHENNEPNYNAVYNLGISGDTTTGMLSRLLPEAGARNPDLMILSLGTNDASRIGSLTSPHATTLNEFERKVKKLIQQSQSLTMNVLIVSAYPIDDTKTVPLFNSNKYYLMSDIKIYIKKTQEICEQNGILYLDLFNALITTDYKKLLYKDGLHMNAQGHQFIFEQLKNFLMSKY